MDRKEKVNQFLESIAGRLGLSLKLNEKAMCRFRDSASQRSCILEILENHDMLYIYCPLMEVPLENRETFFQFLLTLNLHGLLTQHTFLGLDDVKNLIMMSYSFPIDLLDEHLLFNMIANFTASTEKVYQILDTFLKSNSYTKGIGSSRRNDFGKISRFKVKI